jgi:hypothetical protein
MRLHASLHYRTTLSYTLNKIRERSKPLADLSMAITWDIQSPLYYQKTLRLKNKSPEILVWDVNG